MPATTLAFAADLASATPATQAPARLELRNLRKALGDTAAVNGIDLKVAPGESVVLLGPSGCGKTTTLRMVAGFLQPDGGEVHLDGVLSSSASFVLPPEKRRLGMVFQTYAIWPHKTVADNVAYGLEVAGRRRAEIKAEVAAVLDLVQLAPLANRFPAELSGGQQQRVALARALATKPSLLLLDEPLSNLDASLREEMRFELRELQKNLGITTLYVTHDQDEALVLADRIVVMNKGRIEQIGTPEEVYRTPATRFVGSFIGIANLLDGDIVSVDRAGERVLVALDIGGRIWSRAPQAWLANAAAGSRASVLLRPQDIKLEAPDDPGVEQAIGAAFISESFLGEHYELKLAAGETLLRVQSRRRGTFPEGRAQLWARPGSAWVVA
ncbi:ABC transporter ATP-binding protein [Ancylobacter sp. WKF20]|uniref:ABC transporter ATP-binding protein n=1 Tax=Ancylobacter sp. WKF20 TaxID=3039801 RepID=UPI00243418EB|nr:ABC transporter ATP-binding protein [Ancylobacter sp. WKF20]WGD30539.1 ABC transporter ATP-binding protein [Ancylobacter sp. WKF20]